MKITFKLFATLTDYLPPEARRSNQIELDIDPATPISQVIEPFGMPHKLVHLVLVNGKYIHPEQRLSATLKEGELLIDVNPDDAWAGRVTPEEVAKVLTAARAKG